MQHRRTFLRRIATIGTLPILAACGAPVTTTEPTALPPTDAPPTTAPTATIPPPTERPTNPPTTAPTPTNPPPTATIPPKPQFLRTEYLEFGTVAHLYYTDRTRVLTLARIGGFEWVRQQIHWKDIEDSPGVYHWNELDFIVDDVNNNGQKLLVNIVQAPVFYQPNGGKPSDPQTIGNFVEALVKHYGIKIAAIEIWNEPNLAVENGGRVTTEDPGRYAEILIECYKRIKAVEPSIYVLAAAPASTGVTDPVIAMADQEYLRAVYSYKNGIVKDYFDIQAAHPGAAANPPETLYPENPSTQPGWNDHPTHYFRHVENLRSLMVEHGLGDRQIWVTEYGWATPNTTPGFEFGNLTSVEQQADYIIRAITMVDEKYRDEQGRPWIGAMFLWNLNFAVLWGAQGNPQNEQASFGILNPDWSPRPAFIALQGLHMRLKEARRS